MTAEYLVFVADVQGNNAAAQIEIMAVFQPGVGHQVNHLILIRMHANGLGEISVALRIAGYQLTEYRQNVEGIKIV